VAKYENYSHQLVTNQHEAKQKCEHEWLHSDTMSIFQKLKIAIAQRLLKILKSDKYHHCQQYQHHQ